METPSGDLLARAFNADSSEENRSFFMKAMINLVLLNGTSPKQQYKAMEQLQDAVIRTGPSGNGKLGGPEDTAFTSTFKKTFVNQLEDAYKKGNLKKLNKLFDFFKYQEDGKNTFSDLINKSPRDPSLKGKVYGER